VLPALTRKSADVPYYRKDKYRIESNQSIIVGQILLSSSTSAKLRPTLSPKIPNESRRDKIRFVFLFSLVGASGRYYSMMVVALLLMLEFCLD